MKDFTSVAGFIKTPIYKNAKLLVVLWALIIFILCATPGQYIPSANWLELLSFDKFVHAAMFFILTSLLFIVAIKQKQSGKIFMLYFIVAVCYGAALELMQGYCFSNRSADWKDMLANTFGCVIALLMLRKMKSTIQQWSADMK